MIGSHEVADGLTRQRMTLLWTSIAPDAASEVREQRGEHLLFGRSDADAARSVEAGNQS